eukprot:ANDGO_00201.mRNA.1 hypothetical protein CAOG_08618
MSQTEENPFIGFWRRTALFVPMEASEPTDTTSTVLWLQAHRLFIDIRIPAADLHSLLDRKAFAGVGRYDSESKRYTWTRLMDYHPPSCFPDIGLMSPVKDADGLDYLVEDGVDGDDYREHWVRLVPDRSDRMDVSKTVIREMVEADGAIYVRVGDVVGYAKPRSTFAQVNQVPAGQFSSLRDYAVRTGIAEPNISAERENESSTVQALCKDFEVCIGYVQGNEKFVITHSTVDALRNKAISLPNQLAT